MINIQVIPEAFVRINKIKFLYDKEKSVSDELLMFEGLRLLNKINSNINSLLSITYRGSLTTFLKLIDFKTLEKLHKIRSEMCKRQGEIFGEPFIQLFLIWEMISMNESSNVLSNKNPFEYFIRIFERAVILIKFDGSIYLSGYEYDLRSLLFVENYQETPFLVSTTDEYLDNINLFYSEHNVLPNWLEEDNKRGYVL